jgi:AcrR family transcriptional regulator
MGRTDGPSQGPDSPVHGDRTSRPPVSVSALNAVSPQATPPTEAPGTGQAPERALESIPNEFQVEGTARLRADVVASSGEIRDHGRVVTTSNEVSPEGASIGVDPRSRAVRVGRRERARQSLLDAALSLVEQRTWSEITVDDLAATAGLSRTAFYQHFTDRQELLLTLLEGLFLEVDRVGTEWNTGGLHPVEELRRSLELVTDMFAQNGRLFQAVSDAAISDRDVAAAWAALTDGIAADTALGIRRDRENGFSTVTEPEAIARALTCMNERYLLACFGRHPLADPANVLYTLTRIWTRAIYDTVPTSPDDSEIWHPPLG